MLLGVFAILDGKLWTAMQASQTHDTLFFDPDWLFIPHFKGLHRAFFGTQTTANAGVLYIEIIRAPHFFIIDRLSNPFGDKCWGSRQHVAVGVGSLTLQMIP